MNSGESIGEWTSRCHRAFAQLAAHERRELDRLDQEARGGTNMALVHQEEADGEGDDGTQAWRAAARREYVRAA